MSRITFPMYMLATSPQKTSGDSCIISGPGLTPHRIKADNRTAVDEPLGMPNVSKGRRAPPVSALLAPSGAARPSGAPCPNLSGCRETAFSIP